MNFNLTFVGQIIAFAIFVWFCSRYVWPPLVAAIEERQKKIADGLMSAERADKDLELAQNKATEILREAKQEAASIIDAANRRAAGIVDEAKEKGQAEAERIKANASAEIDQEVGRAKEELRSRVATLAVAGAAKILETSVDESKHKSMLDKLAVDL